MPNQPDPSTTGAGNSSTGATLASLYAAYFGAQVAKLDADVVAANASAATTLASGRESRAKHQPRAAGKISAGEHPVSSSLSPEDAALLTEAWMYRDKVAAAIEPTDPRAQDRLDLVKAADSGLSQADDAFTKGKRAIGEFSYRFSIMALDMAISVSPAGWAKFGMEAITGRDMLTNAPLSDFSRGVAIAMTATTVAGLVLTSEMSIPAIVAIDTIGVALKTLSKQARWSEALVEAEKIVNSAKKWDSVESLLHVAKGNYQIAADGTRQLVSGMHTNFGFDNFLKLNQTAGKTFSIRNVTVFTAERIEAGGEILSQTLVNGVKRIQIPRDAWVNARAYDSAVAYTEGGQRLKGVKSLWPESYDIQKIGDITTRLVEANPSVRNDLIEATVDGIKINVRVDAAGKVITSYPAWKQ